METIATPGVATSIGERTAFGHLQSTSVKWSIGANMLGRFWAAGLSLAVVPVYVHLLGIESYGLVGLLVSLQSVLSILDLGLSTTVTREIARCAAGEGVSDAAVLVRTIEAVYWSMAVLIAVTFLLGGSPIAQHLLAVRTQSDINVAAATVIMGVALAIRWPMALYNGVFQGLQFQVFQNTILSVSSTIKAVGAVLLLWLVSPTIHCFLMWQAISNAVEVFLAGLLAWHLLRRRGAGCARFDLAVLRNIWRFSLTVSGASILGTIASQSDKFIIARALPLEQLGYYAVATTATGPFCVIAQATNTALFPRLSASFHRHDAAALSRAYRGGIRLIGGLCIGPAVALMLFAGDVLRTWTGSVRISDAAALPLALMAAAAVLNGIQSVSYNSTFAAGLPRVPFCANFALVVVFVPALMLIVPQWGIVGAASLWLLMNLAIFMALPGWVERRLLAGSGASSWVGDIKSYFLTAAFSLGAAKVLAMFLVPAWQSCVLMLAGLSVYGVLITRRLADDLPLEMRRWLGRWEKIHP